jgi:ABC-type antimicrobial peptide transport system permease subunit
MILKGLLRRKTRTLLTIAGVAIGVAAIIALGTLSEGLAVAYGALSGGSKADLLVAQSDAVDIVFSSVDEEIGQAISALSGVKEVTGMVYTLAPTEGTPYFIVFGYETDGFAIEHFKIVEGEGLTERASQRGGRPLILGRTAADDLDKKVGDMLRLYEVTFRVMGIYETGEPIEEGSAVVTIGDAQTLSKHPRQVNAFLIKLRTLDDAERVQERIEQRFDDVSVTLSSDFAEDQQTLDYIDAFTWAVSFMAVLIGGVGVMNTLLMSIFERTREFGTLRAIGWHAGRVLTLVLGEALVLCGLGGVVGAGLGVAVVWAVRRLPVASSLLVSSFSPGLFVRGIGVALALGLAGGLYPAWRASRLTPAEAMRAESGAGVRAFAGRRSGRPGGRKVPGHTTHTTNGGPYYERQVARPRTLIVRPLRNLLRQPTRTSLTLIGIGIAIMAMVSLGGLAAGLADAMTAMTNKGGAQLVGMEADASVDLSTIDEGIVRRIASLPGVQDAEGFLTGYATVGDLPFFIVFGYHPRGQFIRDFKVVEGQALTANRQIMIGRVAADNLNKRVGQTMRLFNSSFRIVGIYETGTPFEDGAGVISLRDAQTLFGQPHKVSFMGIRLKDPLQAKDVRLVGVQLEAPSRAEELKREIETRFPEVSISQASEFSEDVTDMQMMQDSTWAIAFLALLVGGAGMMNTMVMSVFERTREIGVLRALGWRRGRVLRMILRESLALSLLGAIVGLVTGVVAIAVLNRMPAMAGFVRARFSPGLFVQAIITALVLGAVGGLYPAWRASHLRPVEALRYE